MTGRTVNKRLCARPECGRRFDEPGPGEHRPAPQGYCSDTCHTIHKGSQARKRTARASTLARTGSPSPPRSVSPASPAQRAVVTLRACIVTGRAKADGCAVDPAHLCPRGRGGCDDPLCVVPLWRPVHRAFDDGRFDLLPYLVAHRMYDHVGHALVHYGGDLVALIERLTSCSWTSKGDGHLLTLDRLEALG